MNQLILESKQTTLNSFEKQDNLASKLLELKNCVVPVLKVARAGRDDKFSQPSNSNSKESRDC